MPSPKSWGSNPECGRLTNCRPAEALTGAHNFVAGRANYIVAAGSHPAERVTLSDKGLAALNAMPSGLQGTVGAELVKTKSESSRRDWSQFGELVGGVLAGATKGFAGP